MFCKESPFVVVLQGLLCWVNVSEVLFDFVEAWTEKRRQSVNDKMMSFERFLEERNRAFVPCCSFNWPEIMKSRRLGEKYIDNLWEVVKYKKKSDLPLLSGSWEIANCQPHNYFFIMQIYTKYGSIRKKERKKKSTFCTAMLKSKTPNRISSVQRYYRVTVKYA